MTATYKKLDLTARIVVVANATNPRRPGTAAYRRAGAVLRASGESVADAVKVGAKPSTVRST